MTITWYKADHFPPVTAIVGYWKVSRCVHEHFYLDGVDIQSGGPVLSSAAVAEREEEMEGDFGLLVDN